MKLTSIRAVNFKSFRHLDIRLDNLNVLIGANASGKSNFVQLFAFVRDVVESGLENAISIQGGEYLCNINRAADTNVTIELAVEPENGDPIVPFMPDQGKSRVVRCSYRFSLAFTGARTPIVDEDQLWVERRGSGPTANSNTFTIKREGGRYEMEGGSRCIRLIPSGLAGSLHGRSSATGASNRARDPPFNAASKWPQVDRDV
jgi:hypothetical protein